MKFEIKHKIIALTLLIVVSCNKETCDFIPVCEPLGQNTQNSGLTIVTYNAENPSDFVGAIYDTKNNASAPVGTDWGVALGSAGKITKPADWTLGKIGRVFGIAVDDNENIYLASSGVYSHNFPAFGSNIPYQNAKPGRIYKATAGTYSTTAFVDLSVTYASGAGSFNGIGNIAYDKVNKQLFATNLDDGKIYRISMTGAILQTYDPFTPDTGAPDITTQDEQIWGIGVNYEEGKVKLYFARITTPVTALANRNIYSLTLNSGGVMPTSAPVLEIANIPGTQPAITDIEFSGDTKKMIFAERKEPHNAMVLSYNRLSNSWVSNTQYNVGMSNGKNSAGGVDFSYKGDDKSPIQACDEFIWATGNALYNAQGQAVYGMQGIKYSGNSLSTYSTTDLFIDYDQVNPYVWSSAIGKNDIGDVDVIDANNCFCVIKK